MIINKNKVDNMLAPIGVQPAQREVIINLAKDSLSQVEPDVKKEKRVESRKILNLMRKLNGVDYI